MKIEPGGFANARLIVLSDSPAFHRIHISSRCDLDSPRGTPVRWCSNLAMPHLR